MFFNLFLIFRHLHPKNDSLLGSLEVDRNGIHIFGRLVRQNTILTGNLCFAIMLLSSYMRSLPNELDEAAIIDGAGPFKVLKNITIPLTKPMFATVGIMVFIWSYNDLVTSLVYVSNQKLKPVCVILTMVSNMHGTDYGAMMAAIFITVIPVLILYICSQEMVIKGLTAGAVKG